MRKIKKYILLDNIKYSFGEMLDVTINKRCIEFWNNGNISYECSYRFNQYGRRHGLSRGYFENGNIAYVKHYKNGKEHGLSIGYYENGNIWYEQNYKNGKRHGIRYFKKA